MSGVLRVLVCDDAVSFPVLLRVWLEAEGDVRVVASVATGAEALEAAARTDPDVVLLDLVLPDADDPAALVAALRRRAPRAAVVLCSGMVARDLAVVAREAGADAHVSKASGPERFREAVRAAALAGAARGGRSG